MKLLDEAAAIPASFCDRLRQALDRALRLAEQVAAEPVLEDNARKAASALYHATRELLADQGEVTFSARLTLAEDFWSEVSKYILDWSRAKAGICRADRLTG